MSHLNDFKYSLHFIMLQCLHSNITCKPQANLTYIKIRDYHFLLVKLLDDVRYHALMSFNYLKLGRINLI